jgi:hypothetical protein
VKECIEHANVTNETSVQDEIFDQDDTSLENKTILENKLSLEDVTHPEEEEKDVQVENVCEEYRLYIQLKSSLL